MPAGSSTKQHPLEGSTALAADSCCLETTTTPGSDHGVKALLIRSSVFVEANEVGVLSEASSADHELILSD